MNMHDSRQLVMPPAASPGIDMPALSVVIPVFNEAEGLDALFARLYPALDALGMRYEIVFIDDGSRDRSPGILAAQFEVRPDVTRVILLNGNFGQHRAILAGFEHCRGESIITLDADLQNPPEDIHLLTEALAKGYDCVGTIRAQRQDVAWRRWASRAMNRLRHRLTGMVMTDQGSMMRGYSRNVVQYINQCNEMNTYVPALALQFARNPTEVVVGHEARHAGESKYSLYSLIRLNFDLVTGFSLKPLQAFSMLGIVISLASGFLFVLLLGRRLVLGPEEGGVFTLFALVFLLMGLALFGIGLLGEYVGRIYQEVRSRPRYVISTILERKP